MAAESLGIGSCYIGDIMENYQKHQKLLSLPEWTFPIAMLVMGYYTDKQPVVKPRFDKEYIVFQDSYRRLDDRELEDMFAEKSKKYNPDNSYKAANLGQFMYAKKTAQTLAER